MSGDLEDFLRRAAQRRQAKAAQQPQSQQPARQRPQYSDRRTERVIRPVDTDEVLTAEIVDDDPNSFAARMRRLEEAKKAAKQAEAEIAKQRNKARGLLPKRRASAPALSGNSTADLIAMLQQPSGIRQAILLREILDRPEHRW